MHIDGLTILLVFLLVATAITAWVMHRREVDAYWRLVHASRLLDIRTQQRDEARAQRDAALQHAEECQDIVTLASQDVRTRHPSAPVFTAGQEHLAEREPHLDPRLARHLHVADGDAS